MPEYIGIRWPFRITTQGDADKGPFSDIVKSDIRTVLQTRRFIDLDRGGERVMRPGAFGIVPALLFEPFDAEVLVPLVTTWVEEALDHLVRDGKISIKRILVQPIENPLRLRIIIDYYLNNDGSQDSYETEIQTFNPTNRTVT